MEYAIVDIETTGGHASGCGITEVAIVLHNGQEVIGRYETLINPGVPIPVYITALTGINNSMIATSPSFDQVADKIYNLLQGRVFVAHNVNFDYSFIKYHLAEAGYNYSAPKLCTVRMSRKIKPGLSSYSLGRLCAALEIPLVDRHRAGGDADATAILFSRLLEWDTKSIITGMLKKGAGDQTLPPNLPKTDFEALPRSPGVYYFKDDKGKVIYVGKAKDLRKRVAQHFTGHNPNPQRQNFLRCIHHISFEPCGTELMAFLLEALEIKRLWPKYNRAMKKYEPKFGLFVYEALDGYLRMAIGKFNKSQTAQLVFSHLVEASNVLHEMVHAFDLCPELCRLGSCSSEGGCEAKGGLCPRKTDPEYYNDLVREALQEYRKQLPTFVIVDKGRTEDEQSCIYVEKGHFCAMGYIHKDTDLTQIDDAKKLLSLYQGNHYMMQLIYSYAKTFPEKVLMKEYEMWGNMHN